MEMVPLPCTVTAAVALGMLGVTVLAVIVVLPVVAPVTAKVAVVAPGAMVAVAGTVTIPAGLPARVTVNPPAGAGDDNVSVRFCGVAPASVRLAGEKLRDAPTRTVWLSLVNPAVPVAVIRAEPKATPVTWGCVTGTVAF